jgi:hypothetical protein
MQITKIVTSFTEDGKIAFLTKPTLTSEVLDRVEHDSKELSSGLFRREGGLLIVDADQALNLAKQAKGGTEAIKTIEKYFTDAENAIRQDAETKANERRDHLQHLSTTFKIPLDTPVSGRQATP